ncbi:hypothetical protein NQ318_006239 [Aromia moschata]|uniref:Uncharacterized protein n=1 Tax=Aromia moschata TaxID=1265417 RepID=A0AAV8XVP2_9CUCU|nr:hypothetical protein NQ318_006239 [Aromia moschata]
MEILYLARANSPKYSVIANMAAGRRRTHTAAQGHAPASVAVAVGACRIIRAATPPEPEPPRGRRRHLRRPRAPTSRKRNAAASRRAPRHCKALLLSGIQRAGGGGSGGAAARQTHGWCRGCPGRGAAAGRRRERLGTAAAASAVPRRRAHALRTEIAALPGEGGRIVRKKREKIFLSRYAPNIIRVHCQGRRIGTLHPSFLILNVTHRSKLIMNEKDGYYNYVWGCNLETGLRLLDEQRVKEAEKVAQASTKEGRIAARNRKRQRDEEEALAEDILSPFTINLEQIAPVVKEKSVPK